MRRISTMLIVLKSKSVKIDQIVFEICALHDNLKRQTDTPTEWPTDPATRQNLFPVAYIKRIK